jgi:RNA polymerase sigma-70 factor (ECF subfamily)
VDFLVTFSILSEDQLHGAAGMPSPEPDIEDLLNQAAQGDGAAVDALLLRHRDRLRSMVRLRMDGRLAARMDPSDVVQEALMEAARKLPEYLMTRPVPFYPWLRRLAWERLVKLHERHLHAGKRSVLREEGLDLRLPEDSVWNLAHRLAASGASPSEHAVQVEMAARVRWALAQLAEGDREVLALRYLEELATTEVAAVLGISEAAVKMRHRRALDRLAGLLEDLSGE